MNALIGFLEASRWAEAQAEFQRLTVEAPKSARLLLMGSHAAYGLRDLDQARHLAEESLETWNESDPGRLLGQIRFHLGMVWRELGESKAAVECFELFLSQLAVKYPDLADAEGKAYFYLGLAFRQREELNEATQAYRKAVSCFRRDGLTDYVGRALHNLAWVLCLQKRADEARACLLEAAPLLNDPDHQIHQSMGEAFLAATRGEHAVASALCEAVVRRGQQGEKLAPEERSQTAWVAATAALSQGDSQHAFALAGIALDHAAEAQDARLINDATALRRHILLRQASGQAGA